MAIVYNAALNIQVHTSFQIIVFIFFGYIPRSGIAESYGSSVFSFFKFWFGGYLFLFFIYVFIEVYLTYNVSDVQQSDSVIYIFYIYIYSFSDCFQL